MPAGSLRCRKSSGPPTRTHKQLKRWLDAAHETARARHDARLIGRGRADRRDGPGFLVPAVLTIGRPADEDRTNGRELPDPARARRARAAPRRRAGTRSRRVPGAHALSGSPASPSSRSAPPTSSSPRSSSTRTTGAASRSGPSRPRSSCRCCPASTTSKAKQYLLIGENRMNAIALVIRTWQMARPAPFARVSMAYATMGEDGAVVEGAGGDRRCPDLVASPGRGRRRGLADDPGGPGRPRR